jgi:CRP-like cAMP-binding protein
MEQTTTATLLERSEEARSRGELRVALAQAGEALRLSGDDHRARILVGILLGELGRKESAVKTLLTVSSMLGRRGYVLSAIAACRTAFTLSPHDRDVLAELGRLHDRIAGKPSANRAHVPPPVMPVVYDEHDLESVMLIEDEGKLVSRVEKLAAQDPFADGPIVQPGAVPLFSELSRAAFLSLIEKITHTRLDPGEVIIREGGPGGSLFVIVTGEVKVTRGERLVAKLMAGSLFGEMALLTDQPRSATVTASAGVELFEIAHEHVEAVAAEFPNISQELVDFAKRRLLRNLLEGSPLFQNFEASQRLEILRAFTSRVVAEGAEIIREGKPAPGLFLVAAGEVRITKHDPGGDEVELATLVDGDVLGEISLIEKQGMTTATAIAVRKTVLLHLPRDRFTAIVAAHPTMLDYLSSITHDRLEQTRRALHEDTLDADDLIVI